MINEVVGWCFWNPTIRCFVFSYKLILSQLIFTLHITDSPLVFQVYEHGRDNFFLKLDFLFLSGPSSPAWFHKMSSTFSHLPSNILPPSTTSVIGDYNDLSLSKGQGHRVRDDIEIEGHKAVKNEGNKYTTCAFCLRNKVKTKSGWRVNTYYKCERCQVSLCISPDRNCFEYFHKALFYGSAENHGYKTENL